MGIILKFLAGICFILMVLTITPWVQVPFAPFLGAGLLFWLTSTVFDGSIVVPAHE